MYLRELILRDKTAKCFACVLRVYNQNRQANSRINIFSVLTQCPCLVWIIDAKVSFTSRKNFRLQQPATQSNMLDIVEIDMQCCTVQIFFSNKICLHNSELTHRTFSDLKPSSQQHPDSTSLVPRKQERAPSRAYFRRDGCASSRYR